SQPAREVARRVLIRRGRLVVGQPQLPINLFAVHLDVTRCANPEPNHVTTDFEHGDDHVVTDHHALPGTAGQYEHPATLPSHRALRNAPDQCGRQHPSGARTGSPLPVKTAWTARRLTSSTRIGAIRLAVASRADRPTVTTRSTRSRSGSPTPSSSSGSLPTSGAEFGKSGDGGTTSKRYAGASAEVSV